MDKLTEIEERWAKTKWTTEGPTQNSESYDCWYVREGEAVVAETDAWVDPQSGPYANKIAMAPEDISWLIAEVKRLRDGFESLPAGTDMARNPDRRRIRTK